jgi:hypothetical protein
MQHIAASFRLIVALLAAALGFAAGPASAQTYPTQPIKIIVATAAGGIADLVARTLAQKLSEGGKTTLVENRRRNRRGCRGEGPARRLHAVHRHALDQCHPASSGRQAAV